MKQICPQCNRLFVLYGDPDVMKLTLHEIKLFEINATSESPISTQWPPLYNGHFFGGQSTHWLLFKPLQRPLFSVPKVAVVKRFNCSCLLEQGALDWLLLEPHSRPQSSSFLLGFWAHGLETRGSPLVRYKLSRVAIRTRMARTHGLSTLLLKGKWSNEGWEQRKNG